MVCNSPRIIAKESFYFLTKMSVITFISIVFSCFVPVYITGSAPNKSIGNNEAHKVIDKGAAGRGLNVDCHEVDTKTADGLNPPNTNNASGRSRLLRKSTQPTSENLVSPLQVQVRVPVGAKGSEKVFISKVEVFLSTETEMRARLEFAKIDREQNRYVSREKMREYISEFSSDETRKSSSLNDSSETRGRQDSAEAKVADVLGGYEFVGEHVTETEFIEYFLQKEKRKAFVAGESVDAAESNASGGEKSETDEPQVFENANTELTILYIIFVAIYF